MARDVSGGVYVPFWEDLPHTDIHTAITPDVLHQIYQGVFKHLVSWCQICITPEELDRRLRTLPPSFGGRHFENGISALSQVTGTDRKHVARALLGCLVGVMPPRGIRACRGVLDFMYYAQYKSHDDASLDEMQRALDMWESNKMFFVSDVPVREHLNIPKLHSLHHYISSIRLLGTTDNYNTEMFERLHIDFAKRGWRASNKRNAFPQMVAWLERQEKVMAFERYLTAVEPERPIAVLRKKRKLPVTTVTPLSFSVAKFPDRKAQKLVSIELSHAAPGFSLRLKQLLNTLIPNPTSARRASTFTLPFDAVDVFHQFKVYPTSVDFDDDEVLSETVKATPRSREKPARFDTAIILQADTADCAGVEGTLSACIS
uniref:Uncharacterized protein n=1 Tax=Schizophyllum commune (strain H4-8 / FGSC 9210) TaxID=578458 RepID=D8PN10_SCHCM